MKKLISSILILNFNFSFATPTGIKNETASIPTYTQNVVLPNNQSTKQAGLDTRIETGNTNLLINPSFEHSTVNAGWTKIGVTNTFTKETSFVIDGKSSMKYGIVSTSATEFYQDSTINASSISGLQGKVSAYVKTTVAGLQICPRQAGSVVTSLCVSVINDGNWREYNIPVILNGTSNGISIYRSGTTTGDVYIDNAFVGLSSPFQNVSGAKLVGTVTITGCTSNWSTTSTSYVDFSANTSCTYTTTGQAVADTSFGTTQLPSIKFSTLLAGDYRLEAEGLLGASGSSDNAGFQFWDGTNTAKEQSMFNGTSSGTVQANGISQSISYSSSKSNVTLSIRGKGLGTSTATVYGQSTWPLTIKVWYFPPESKIYSQASQDYAYTNAGTITIGATTTAPTKGTVVTDRVMASRKGQNLRARYQYEQSTAGTAGSGDYLFTLPSGLSFDSNIINFYTGTNIAGGNPKSIIGYGRMADGTTESYIATLMAYDATRFRVIVGYGAGNAKFATNALWAFSNTSMGFDFEVDAPIQGWQDYGVIVGSFQYVPQVPGQSNVDTFIVSFGTTNGTTVCSASPCSYLDQIGNAVSSITRTTTATYALNTIKTYSKLKCTGSAGNASNFLAIGGTSSSMTCSSCNSLPFQTGTGPSSADGFGTLYCQGSY